ncbi:hypothetical protein C7S18_12355 [Ahniella affigens]|uniref:Uncharacterized protein n=1 Tax=Ahniella affigens TaxID=2021234 RepID=A0A2P1PSX8_9GAMM|nr:hypothetical protein [Ahniella affigens]AVP97944.1 hypothetical protein C7S18_12355 [Ahniella affigens]
MGTNLDDLIAKLAANARPGTAFAAMAGLQGPSGKEKWPFDRQAVPAPLRRRVALGRISLHVDRYNLDELLQTLLDAAGFRRLAEVPDDDLFRLELWLEAHVERLETGCSDPHGFPAS